MPSQKLLILLHDSGVIAALRRPNTHVAGISAVNGNVVSIRTRTQ